MKILYAPWREQYASSPEHPSRQKNATSTECVFCLRNDEQHDEQNFILRRFQHCYVMLNKYPYNSGHLLVIPYAHSASLHELSKEARAELMEAVSQCTDLVKNVLRCDGVNVGINIGQGAGAGIPSHLHIHVLPRWQNDTNFLPTLADTKVVSFEMKKIYEQLKKAF